MEIGMNHLIDAVCVRFPEVAVAYEPHGDWSFTPREDDGIPIVVRDDDGEWVMSRACAAVSVKRGSILIEVHYNHPDYFTRYVLKDDCTKSDVESILNGLFLNSSSTCCQYLNAVRMVKNDHLGLVQIDEYDDDAICEALAHHLAEVSKFVSSDFTC
jgi:hypothetical protein